MAEGHGVVCAHADPAVIYQKLRKSFYKLLITRLYYGGFMLHNRQYRCYRDSIPIATWIGSYPTRIDALSRPQRGNIDALWAKTYISA